MLYGQNNYAFSFSLIHRSLHIFSIYSSREDFFWINTFSQYGHISPALGHKPWLRDYDLNLVFLQDLLAFRRIFSKIKYILTRLIWPYWPYPRAWTSDTGAMNFPILDRGLHGHHNYAFCFFPHLWKQRRF